MDPRVIRHEPLGFHDYNCLQMNADGGFGFTSVLLDTLKKHGNSDYGKSKLAGEDFEPERQDTLFEIVQADLAGSLKAKLFYDIIKYNDDFV